MRRLMMLAALAPTLLRAGVYDVGSTTGQIWKLNLDPRSDAMGEAVVAIPDGPLGWLVNPAGLPVKSGGLQVVDTEWFQGVRAGTLGLAQGLGTYGSFGFAAGALSIPDQEITQLIGAGPDPRLNYRIVGGFSPAYVEAALAYAKDLFWGIRAGGALKVERQQLGDYTDQAFSVDLGLLYRWKDLRLGLSAQNFGPAVPAGEAGFGLPATVRMGAAYQGKGWPVMITAEGDMPRDNAAAAAVGLEYSPADAFYLRAGYRRDGIFNPWTLGLGLRLGPVGVDLSTSPAADLGQTYHAGLRLDWGADEEAIPEEVTAFLAYMGHEPEGWALALEVSERRAVAKWELWVHPAGIPTQVFWRQSGEGRPPAKAYWPALDAWGRRVPGGTYEAEILLTLKNGQEVRGLPLRISLSR